MRKNNIDPANNYLNFLSRLNLCMGIFLNGHYMWEEQERTRILLTQHPGHHVSLILIEKLPFYRICEGLKTAINGFHKS